MDVAQTVRAAGGVVLRRSDDGRPRIMLVHRPKYDDWTLPKGKANDGESDEACALREVAEEAGFRCELEEELPSTSYVDGHGRPKNVRYWRMHVVDGDFRPHAEVDEIRWVTPEEARELLSYERDIPPLEAAL